MSLYSPMSGIPDKIEMRVTSFFVVKVDDKYWMEEFPPGRSDVSDKGFTSSLLHAYRIEKRGRTLQEANVFPAWEYLRPDFLDYFPALKRGVLVEVKLVESIAEEKP